MSNPLEPIVLNGASGVPPESGDKPSAVGVDDRLHPVAQVRMRET